MSTYRKQLLSSYWRRVDHLDPDSQAKIDWFAQYAREYYWPFLPSKDSAIVDLGCSRGYLLCVLRNAGYRSLFGVDISLSDVERASVLVPEADIKAQEVLSFLEEHRQEFDVVIAKAILEHMPKDQVIPFLELTSNSLRAGGRVIIDVPNMDWLFAGHERYMDFTHEVGFTKESLQQVMEEVFVNVSIYPAESDVAPTRLALIKRQFARAVLHRLLRWADYGGASNAIWARSIVGIGCSEHC